MIFEFSTLNEAELTYKLKVLPVTHKLLALPKELKDEDVNILAPLQLNRKTIGFKLLQYFALIEDPDSPYYYHPYDSRKQMVEDVVFDNKKEKDYVNNKVYLEFVDTLKPLLVIKEQEMLDTYYLKLEEIQELLKENKITIENMELIMNSMAKLDKLFELGDKLKSKLESKKNASKTRGNIELSAVESLLTVVETKTDKVSEGE